MKKILFLSIFVSIYAFAIPSPDKLISHPKSACKVFNTGEMYTAFHISKNNKKIHIFKSDGISKVLFSISGEYIAFGGSEVAGVDVKEKIFHMAIYNCKTEKLKGFNLEVKGLIAAWPIKWEKKDSSLKFEYYHMSVVGEQTTVMSFDKNNSLP